MAELDTTRYILLTTFKRDGTAVASPVWITGSAGTYTFTTGDRAWKTRRLRHNPAVQVQACGMRGGVKPGAARYPEVTALEVGVPTFTRGFGLVRQIVLATRA
jgi:hypothetical protein